MLHRLRLFVMETATNKPETALADARWARLDRTMTDRAAWVPFATPRAVRLLSKPFEIETLQGIVDGMRTEIASGEH